MTFDLYQWSVLTTLTRHLLDCDLSNVIGDGMFVLVGLCELWVDPAPPPPSPLLHPSADSLHRIFTPK